jgi:AGZA family xanthine/uracil permease-like MFS transporter
MIGALVIAGGIYYLMQATGTLGHEPEAIPFDPHDGLLPTGWLTAFQFEWLARLPDALHYLPIVIPFALATVVGGIDCTESAAAAGDEFDTGKVIAVEAFATLVAGCCGGVIQTTPYIGS